MKPSDQNSKPWADLTPEQRSEVVVAVWVNEDEAGPVLDRLKVPPDQMEQIMESHGYDRCFYCLAFEYDIQCNEEGQLCCYDCSEDKERRQSLLAGQ